MCFMFDMRHGSIRDVKVDQVPWVVIDDFVAHNLDKGNTKGKTDLMDALLRERNRVYKNYRMEQRQKAKREAQNSKAQKAAMKAQVEQAKKSEGKKAYSEEEGKRSDQHNKGNGTVKKAKKGKQNKNELRRSERLKAKSIRKRQVVMSGGVGKDNRKRKPVMSEGLKRKKQKMESCF